PRTGLRAGGILLAIVGAGCAGGGIYFSIDAADVQRRANQAVANHGAWDPTWSSRGPNDNLGQGFLYAGAAVAVTGAVILSYFGWRRARRSAPGCTPSSPGVPFMCIQPRQSAGSALSRRLQALGACESQRLPCCSPPARRRPTAIPTAATPATTS